MNRLVVLVVVFLIVFISCTKETDKQEKIIIENLTTYLKAKIAEYGEDATIDSILVAKVDTLTPLQDSMYLYRIHINEFDKVKVELETFTEKAKMRTRQAELSKEIGSNNMQYFLDDAQKNLNGMIEQKKIMDYHIQEATRIDSVVMSGSIDSVTVTGYRVEAKIYAHDSRQANKDNTEAVIILDKNYRVDERRMTKLGLLPE